MVLGCSALAARGLAAGPSTGPSTGGGAAAAASQPAAGAGAGAANKAPSPDPRRLEMGVLPALSGDSDIGFGFGLIGSFARFAPNYKPYKWRLEALWFMTAKAAPDGSGTEFPYHDDYLILDLPGLARGALRLNAELRFARFTTSGYFGFGNAARVDEQQRALNGRYHMYDRIYPSAELKARLQLLPGLSLFVGSRFVYNWLRVYDGSQLQGDLQRVSSDSALAALLLGASGRYPLFELSLGWIFDTRDHEYAPSSGVFHELSWRAALGDAIGLDYPYGGLNLTARVYRSLGTPRLVFAGRLMADLLFGRPPFFELASHGGFARNFALGGGKAIRGVPQQRYHGKVKLLANGELRAKLLPFSLGSERFNLGLVAFVDAGRVVTELGGEAFEEGGLGLKLGAGGGLRLQWGETFIVRADVAWSPDAEPMGIYIDISHIF